MVDAGRHSTVRYSRRFAARMTDISCHRAMSVRRDTALLWTHHDAEHRHQTHATMVHGTHRTHRYSFMPCGQGVKPAACRMRAASVRAVNGSPLRSAKVTLPEGRRCRA